MTPSIERQIQAVKYASHGQKRAKERTLVKMQMKRLQFETRKYGGASASLRGGPLQAHKGMGE